MRRPSRVAPSRSAALLTSLLAGALLSGCYIKTQRFPGPMGSAVDPLPPGTTDLHPAGPEEVLILRIADPVLVRRPGDASSFPLYFFRKQARMNSGSWVFCGAGGRLEVLYPGNSSITLFGLGSGVVGSESRGEPLFFLRQVDRAAITLKEGEQVRLLSGAMLSCDGGPVVLEHLREEILRIRNRSQASARIAFREVLFTLDPGHVIDLPLLESGASPLEVDPGFQTLATAGAPIQVRGEVDVVEDTRGTLVRAVGDNELRTLGVRVRLRGGEEVRFSDLSIRTEGLDGEGPPVDATGPGPESPEGATGDETEEQVEPGP